MMQFTNFSQLREAVRGIGVDNFEGKLLEKLKLGKLEGNTNDRENLVFGKFGIYYLEKGKLAKVILHITDIEKRWIEQNDPNAIGLLDKKQYDAQTLVKTFHKYHFTQCQTLNYMFNHGRRKKYYLAQRMDGTFNYSVIDDNKVIHKNENQTLHVCQNCLDILGGLTGKNYTVINFMPKEIFNTPVPGLLGRDFDLACNAVPNIYANDWLEISAKAKEQVGWRCEGCDLDLSNDTQYLHCHHIDSNRANNLIGNLRVLCIFCHANEPNHQRIKKLSNYNEFVSIYKNLSTGDYHASQ